MSVRWNSLRTAFLFFGLLTFVLPFGAGASWLEQPRLAAIWIAALALGAFAFQETAGSTSSRNPVSGKSIASLLFGMAALFLGAAVPLGLISAGIQGGSALGLWCAVLSLGFLAWGVLENAASAAQPGGAAYLGILAPGIFGVWILYLWQVIANGFAIPPVLLPAPSDIGTAIGAAPGTLAGDFFQTVLKSVLPGYVIGNAAGFIVALLADRLSFLQRGLLPFGNFFSSLPIVGLAPIMVMWFGFDWQSKAAIVVVMTFFPMLVNAIAGFAQTSQTERDLMRSYAASYWQTMLKVRLPAALPFVFNALKINSTLALIGAIVAEFFGSPTIGLGFRISTEAGRMNIVMVWAAIAVAAATGSAFYGLLALLERRSAFWHPSFRRAA
ncbi:MAG: ABC transporter permease [Rhodomicrobium sp.]